MARTRNGGNPPTDDPHGYDAPQGSTLAIEPTGPSDAALGGPRSPGSFPDAPSSSSSPAYAPRPEHRGRPIEAPHPVTGAAPKVGDEIWYVAHGATAVVPGILMRKERTSVYWCLTFWNMNMQGSRVGVPYSEEPRQGCWSWRQDGWAGKVLPPYAPGKAE